LLGKRADSPEVVAMIDSLPATPRLTVTAGQLPTMWINSYEAGLSICFSLPDGLMINLAFYADGRDGYCPYRGELPNALKLDEARRAVEKGIGPPLEMGPASHKGVDAYYPKLGLRLTYGNDAPRDPQNPLVRLSLSEPAASGRATTLPNYDGTIHLAFRLVVPDDSHEAHLPERFVNANDGTAAFVSTTVIVDEHDIDDAHATQTEKGTPAILLKIGAAGAARLEGISATNAGRQIAIILDKQLLMAPMIRGKMGTNIMIEMGAKRNDDELFDMARKLRRAIYALPPEGTSP